jgi:hypothetical protein
LAGAIRVLHAPTLVGGNPYGYPADEQLATPAQGRLAFELQRWRLLWRALGLAGTA